MAGGMAGGMAHSRMRGAAMAQEDDDELLNFKSASKGCAPNKKWTKSKMKGCAPPTNVRSL